MATTTQILVNALRVQITRLAEFQKMPHAWVLATDEGCTLYMDGGLNNGPRIAPLGAGGAIYQFPPGSIDHAKRFRDALRDNNRGNGEVARLTIRPLHDTARLAEEQARLLLARLETGRPGVVINETV